LYAVLVLYVAEGEVAVAVETASNKNAAKVCM